MQRAEKTRLAMITGSYPPMPCGIGDYSYRLSESIRSGDIEVHVFTSDAAAGGEHITRIGPAWGMFKMLFLLRKILIWRPEIVHIQYPALGYKFKLGPQLLVCLMRFSGLRVVTTIHEFRMAHIIRKISLIPFFVFSNFLVFTSEEEKDAVTEKYSWLKGKIKKNSEVIPVGSNIPVAKGVHKRGVDGDVVSFFGLFYPGRKIETVIGAFKKISAKRTGVKLRLIGNIHDGHKDYFLKIKKLVENTFPERSIEWVISESYEKVSEALAHSDVCVLPYPDGASFRRTTFIAAISHGVPVVTTKGHSTPSNLYHGNNVLFAEDETEIAEMIEKVLLDDALAERLSKGGLEISKGFTWEHLTERHLAVYRRVTGI